MNRPSTTLDIIRGLYGVIKSEMVFCLVLQSSSNKIIDNYLLLRRLLFPFLFHKKISDFGLWRWTLLQSQSFLILLLLPLCFKIKIWHFTFFPTPSAVPRAWCAGALASVTLYPSTAFQKSRFIVSEHGFSLLCLAFVSFITVSSYLRRWRYPCLKQLHISNRRPWNEKPERESCIRSLELLQWGWNGSPQYG